jgi:hypothetical protein
MSGLWAKIVEIAVPWLLEKVATIISKIIRQKKSDEQIAKKEDEVLDELKKAETKEQVEDAAKNTLGL